MAYKGETRTINCDSGGLTGANNIDAIAPQMMIYPSRNILLEKRGRRKRGGSSHLYASAYPGGYRALGLFDCRFLNGNQYLVYADASGTVYKNATNTITTGMGTSSPFSFAMGENKLFIADGISMPKVWNEGSCANIANPATDWSSNPPFQFLRHTRGLSERMCAINENTLYFSKTYVSAGDMEQFVTGAESIYLDTADGHGMVGMVEIGEEIVLFSREKAWRVDDSDVTSTNWGLTAAQWAGGVAHWRLIVKIPNDVVCMSADGEIYSIRAVADYGDYKQASLTKDSWMHDWIKEHVNLSQINLFSGKYFPKWRAVVFSVCSSGSTTCDTMLIYYIDRAPENAWMVHDNSSAPSGYDASAIEVVEDKTNGSYTLYTADYAGYVWELDKTSRNDNGAAYYSGFKTANDAMGEQRIKKLFAAGRIIGEPIGEYSLNVAIWVDGDYLGIKTVDQNGAGALLDDFMLDDDYLSGEDVCTSFFRIGKEGHQIQYEIYNAAANEDFFITSIMTDHKVLGALQR